MSAVNLLREIKIIIIIELVARREAKSCWPVSKQIQVPGSKRSKFLGPGGLNIKKITGDTGVQMHQEEEGRWTMFAPSNEALQVRSLQLKKLIEIVRHSYNLFGQNCKRYSCKN